MYVYIYISRFLVTAQSWQLREPPGPDDSGRRAADPYALVGQIQRLFQNKLATYMEKTINWGPLFGSPYNRDHSILGSILGPLSRLPSRV